MQIVVVDDEPLFLNTVADFLRRCGHQVVAAENGSEAVHRIGDQIGAIDLVISDICMPQTDGPALLRSIKEHHPDIDVILVTAFSQSMDAVSAIKEGACALLHKPVKLNELEVVINQIQQRRTERAQLHEMQQSVDAHQQQIQDSIRDRIFARRLHSQIFPRQFGFMPRTRFQLRHLPQGGVGGDFADARPWGRDQALIMVADVSGHGTPAAFGGIALKTWFTSLEPGLGPSQVLRKADRLFADIFPEEYYATGFCAVYNERDRRLDYCLAGHPAPMRCSPTNGLRLLPGDGPAIGLQQEAKRTEHRTHLKADEVCLIYTDGLTQDPGQLGTALNNQIDELALDATTFSDLPRLVTTILDCAIGLDPLRAFADDLTIFCFGPARPKDPERSPELDRRSIIVACQDAAQRKQLVSAFQGTGAAVIRSPVNDQVVDAMVDCEPDLLVMADPSIDLMADLIDHFEQHFMGLPVLVLYSANQAAEAARLGLATNVAGIRAWPCSDEELIAAATQALTYDADRDRVEFDQIGIDWMDFVIASSDTSLDLLGRYLEAIGRQPMPPAVLSDVVYCVKELAGNAIEWGNLRHPDLRVRISTVILPDRVMIKITDEGSGFDTHTLFTPDELLEAMAQRDLIGKRPGGFGLNIVKEKMDRVEFNQRGNAVVLCKLFTSSPPVDDEPAPQGSRHQETVTARSALDRHSGTHDHCDPTQDIDL